MAIGEWTLWGSHPAYTDSTPIKLQIGSLRQARAAQRQRERDGGWLLAIYKWGTKPIGLREQVTAQQRVGQPPQPNKAGQTERDNR